GAGARCSSSLLERLDPHVARSLHPVGHGRPFVASVPYFESRAGRLTAEQLLQTPGHGGVGPGVAAGRSRENVEEALHVSPQPAHRDAGAILASGGDRLAGEEDDTEAGEVAPGVV